MKNSIHPKNGSLASVLSLGSSEQSIIGDPVGVIRAHPIEIRDRQIFYIEYTGIDCLEALSGIYRVLGNIQGRMLKEQSKWYGERGRIVIQCAIPLAEADLRYRLARQIQTLIQDEIARQHIRPHGDATLLDAGDIRIRVIPEEISGARWRYELSLSSQTSDIAIPLRIQAILHDQGFEILESDIARDAETGSQIRGEYTLEYGGIEMRPRLLAHAQQLGEALGISLRKTLGITAIIRLIRPNIISPRRPIRSSIEQSILPMESEEISLEETLAHLIGSAGAIGNSGISSEIEGIEEEAIAAEAISSLSHIPAGAISPGILRDISEIHGEEMPSSGTAGFEGIVGGILLSLSRELMGEVRDGDGD